MPEDTQSNLKIWDAAPGFDFNEAVDLAEIPSWFIDGAHSTPPLTTMAGYLWVKFCGHGMKYALETLCVPTCKGWELRFLNGAIYCGLHIVRDEKEIMERAVKFRQALRPWIDDWDNLWAGCKKELLDIYARLKSLNVDTASNLQLSYHNYDLMNAYKRMWEIHHIGMYSSHNAWMLLEALAQERFGLSDKSPEFQDMMRGFDNKIYQMDKKMWDFGRLAVEMGLENTFKENDPPAVLSRLQQSEKGKEWFRKLMHYMETDDVGGWRTRRFTDFTEPYWLEDPATPIGLVKDNILRGDSYDLEAIRAKTAVRREAAIASFLSRVPSEERDLFEGLIRLSGKISSFSEEHDLYCELMSHSFIRRGYLAMGKRLAAAGAIDEPIDILMLNPEEIDRVITVPDGSDMRWITRRRKAAWLEAHRNPNPPVFTRRKNLEEAAALDLMPSRDPIALKITIGEIPQPKHGLKADIWGICGCAGEAEGTARVVVLYEDLKNVKRGDILVCPSANPAWTSVFGLVKGVIADTGGTLCHAAIIGREYGVPTIVNTKQATTKIKTGQRVRIDAGSGAIFILS